MIPLTKMGEMAAKYPQHPALIEGDRVVAWPELQLLTERCLRGLVNKHDALSFKRVAYMAENRYEIVILMGAFSTLKVPFVGLDFTATYEQKAHCVKSIEADCLVYGEKFADEALQIASELNIPVICLETELPSLLSDEFDGLELQVAGIERPFESLSFTSGTSGLPKVVYRNAPFDARRFGYLIENFYFDQTDVFLVSLPFYHVSATGWARLFMGLGGTVVLGDAARPASMAQLMVDRGVTVTLMVPPTLHRVVKAFETQAVTEEPKLKFLIVGGKNFPVQLKHRSLDVLGPVVHEYYGSTETGVNTISRPENIRRHPDSVGLVMDGSDIVILDEFHQIAPTGVKGKVAIYSYQNMAGYLFKKSDAVVIDDKVYIITPDFGWFDEEGYLFLASRSNSEYNVYEVDNRLRDIAGIDDLYVMVDSSSELHIFIMTEHEANEEAIGVDVIAAVQELGFANAHVRMVAEIPYSMSGKVKEKDLKMLYQVI